jgi:hypothetical protein
MASTRIHPRTAKSAAVQAEAFEARFPRLRLASFKFEGRDGDILFSVAGSGDELIHAGFLTRCMIDAMPRGGVKRFYPRYSDGAGIYGTVRRIESGFRVTVYMTSRDILGVFRTLRETWGLKAKGHENAAAFAAVFPGLHLINQPVFENNTFTLWIQGHAAGNFLRAGFLTQAMIDAVDGDVRDKYFKQFPDEHSHTDVERMPANMGYKLQVYFGKDTQGLGAIVRKLFLKEQEPARPTRLAFCESMLETVVECTRGRHPYYPNAFPAESLARIRSHVSAILHELKDRSTPDAPRPSHLRLAVDNTVQP